jgi:hypothetical protein
MDGPVSLSRRSPATPADPVGRVESSGLNAGANNLSAHYIDRVELVWGVIAQISQVVPRAFEPLGGSPPE